MKKFFCLLLSAVLLISAASAAEITPARKFRNQFITGGSGVKGTVSLTASGNADWLEYVLPFTASELQVRIIGQAQGKYSEVLGDDDEWQAKFFAEDANGEAYATTHLYGNAAGIFLSSDLLPDVLLSMPVKNVNLPNALIDGEFASLFTSLDPLGLLTAESDGRPASYSALAELAAIPDSEWAEQWAPVMQKYDIELEMWLAAYGTAPVVNGGTGSMTVKTTYSIPADDLKDQAKKFVGMMLYDQELLPLLSPLFTAEQQQLYLNPDLVYFYEFCIDALPLNGNIVLESEMTAMGETVGLAISLPLPELPSELTAPVSELLANCFELPYTDVLSNIDRISYRKTGDDATLSLSSPSRTISLTVTEMASSAEASQLEGFVRINPAVGNSESPLAAAFSYKTNHTVWKDENGAAHDDVTYSMAVSPDLTLLDDDDPFRSSYIDFAPLRMDTSLQYFTKTDSSQSATRLQINMQMKLRDAELGLDADLRTASQWAFENLRTVSAESILDMNDDRKVALLDMLRDNAIATMIGLGTPSTEATEEPDIPEETELPEATSTFVPEATTVPTAVPPML